MHACIERVFDADGSTGILSPEQPMLTIAFRKQPGSCTAPLSMRGWRNVYVREGYEPFVDMLLANGKVKTNLFIEGVTARHIADKISRPGRQDPPGHRRGPV